MLRSHCPGFCSPSATNFMWTSHHLPRYKHQLSQDAMVFPESCAPAEAFFLSVIFFFLQKPLEVAGVEPISTHRHPSPKLRLCWLTAPWRTSSAICPNSLQHILAEQDFVHKDIIPQYFLLFSPSLFMASRPLRYSPFVRESFNDLGVIMLASV